MSVKIFVTQSFIPSWEQYEKFAKRAFEKKWLTNNGELVNELMCGIESYLGIKNTSLVTNGTIALQLPLKSLEKGEIITTPYSYVATVNAIIWEGHTPVFVDICDQSWCVNPSLIEEKITPRTKAILATHVYGVPCDVHEIERIALKHKLTVIYDAAHAFGVKFQGESLLAYGDFSTLSMHATKLFHSAEGGLVVCKNERDLDLVDKMKSFGHRGDEYFGLGINGKMSELHAAMGLSVLPYVDQLIEARRIRTLRYDGFLASTLQKPILPENTEYNFSYYPVLLPSPDLRESVERALAKENVFPRRYFYPSLNKLPHVKGERCPVSEDYAERVLCLPLYPELELTDIDRISKTIRGVI